MTWQTVHKTERPDWPAPNLGDYEKACADFAWQQASAAMTALPGSGLNIAFEAVDRHLDDDLADKVAIRWLEKNLCQRDISYRELAALTSRFAHLLVHLGVVRGERVFSLLGRVPELYVAALGTLKAGRVFSPLFSAFGPEPIGSACDRRRPGAGDDRVLYRRKVAPWPRELPGLEHILLRAGETSSPTVPCLSPRPWPTAPQRRLANTRPEDMALLHFTSGTTGQAQGRDARPRGGRRPPRDRSLRAGPARRTTSTGAPPIPAGSPAPPTASSRRWLNGVTNVVDEAEFDAERWYGILQERAGQRLVHRADRDPHADEAAVPSAAKAYDLSHLRFMASVGEPLNPEAVVWGQRGRSACRSTTTGGRPRPAAS